jgi:hypothetical protein
MGAKSSSDEDALIGQTANSSCLSERAASALPHSAASSSAASAAARGEEEEEERGMLAAIEYRLNRERPPSGGMVRRN